MSQIYRNIHREKIQRKTKNKIKFGKKVVMMAMLSEGWGEWEEKRISHGDLVGCPRLGY